MNTLDVTVMMWIAMSVAWLLGAWYTFRASTAALRHFRIALIAAAGVAAVCAVSFSDVLSDDGIRYRWDGWVTSHGVNPYDFAPRDSAVQWLAHVDAASGTRYPADVTYPHMRTIYPPAANVISGGIALVAGTDAFAWSLAWRLLVIALIAIAARLLWHDLMRSTLLMLAVACPAFTINAFMDVHYDVVMALCALIGMLLWKRDAFLMAGIVIGTAVMVKYVAILAVPFLLLTLTTRERIKHLTGLGIGVAIFMIPLASVHMFDSLYTFAELWQSNSFLYTLGLQVSADEVVRYMLLALTGAALTMVWLRHRHNTYVATSLAIMAIMLCAPVVHAWYLILPLILLPVAPLRSVMVWGATICVYGLAVQTYKRHGVWTEDTVALAIEFIPVMVAWGVDVWKGALSASPQVLSVRNRVHE